MGFREYLNIQYYKINRKKFKICCFTQLYSKLFKQNMSLKVFKTFPTWQDIRNPTTTTITKTPFWHGGTNSRIFLTLKYYLVLFYFISIQLFLLNQVIFMKICASILCPTVQQCSLVIKFVYVVCSSSYREGDQCPSLVYIILSITLILLNIISVKNLKLHHKK